MNPTDADIASNVIGLNQFRIWAWESVAHVKEVQEQRGKSRDAVHDLIAMHMGSRDGESIRCATIDECRRVIVFCLSLAESVVG